MRAGEDNRAARGRITGAGSVSRVAVVFPWNRYLSHMRGTLLLLFVATGLSARPQFDALPDAQAAWTTSFWIGPGYPHQGFYHTYDEASPDTLYQGVVYKKLTSSVSVGDQVYPGGYAGALHDNEQGQVYFWEPGTEEPVLLYDFDVLPGDTILDVYGLYPQDVRVFAVDTIVINGTGRKRVELECLEQPGVAGEYWIQGIGSARGPFYMTACGSVSGLGELVCMTVNDTVQWGLGTGGTGACDLLLGGAEKHTEVMGDPVFPVPAEDILYVPNVRLGAAVVVIAVDGTIRSTAARPDASIDVEPLAAGAYTLRYMDRGGNLRSARFVKR